MWGYVKTFFMVNQTPIGFWEKEDEKMFFSLKLSFDSELRCLKISSEPSASKVSRHWWSSISFITTQIKGKQSLTSPLNESNYDQHNVVWVFDRQRWH